MNDLKLLSILDIECHDSKDESYRKIYQANISRFVSEIEEHTEYHVNSFLAFHRLSRSQLVVYIPEYIQKLIARAMGERAGYNEDQYVGLTNFMGIRVYPNYADNIVLSCQQSVIRRIDPVVVWQNM